MGNREHQDALQYLHMVNFLLFTSFLPPVVTTGFKWLSPIPCIVAISFYGCRGGAIREDPYFGPNRAMTSRRWRLYSESSSCTRRAWQASTPRSPRTGGLRHEISLTTCGSGAVSQWSGSPWSQGLRPASVAHGAADIALLSSRP